MRRRRECGPARRGVHQRPRKQYRRVSSDVWIHGLIGLHFLQKLQSSNGVSHLKIRTKARDSVTRKMFVREVQGPPWHAR